jgi:hypothetical protein
MPRRYDVNKGIFTEQGSCRFQVAGIRRIYKFSNKSVGLFCPAGSQRNYNYKQ